MVAFSDTVIINILLYKVDLHNKRDSWHVSDPKPTCGVTSPPIRGESVTLSCTMTYRRHTDEYFQNPGAGFSASIGWESAAGTSSNTSIPVTSSVGYHVGETLTVDVVTLASETEIPSYNCTAEFSFTGRSISTRVYALNDVSWTCVSAPVITWCTYFNLSL